jgi:hypothetical protein
LQIQKRYQFALAALAGIGLIVYLSWPPSEPIVNGQPLGYWLDRLKGNGPMASPEAMAKALAETDDRCIPWLTDQLNWQPSHILRKVEGLTWEWFHHYMKAEPRDRRTEAALVLGSFGPRAKSAIPALENLSHLRGPDTETEATHRGAAIAALILIRGDSMDACARKSLDLSDTNHEDYWFAILSLRTNAGPCVPVYVNAIQTTTNNKVKMVATQMLGEMCIRPELSLPTLVSLLKDTNGTMRFAAALALMRFGSAAKPAWNDLVASLNDPDPKVRTWATNALTEIDPDAAKQIGLTPFY